MKYHELEKFNEHHLVYKPSDIVKMPPKDLVPFATQASKYIAKYGEGNMFQYTPEELQAFMLHGLAMFTTDFTGMLSGFIKVDPWVNYPQGAPDNDGLHGSIQVLQHIDDQKAHIVGLESGSLVVHENYREHKIATHLKTKMAEYAMEQLPNVPIFSVVTNTNTKSIGLNKKVLWHPITPEQSLDMIHLDVLNVPGWDSTIPVTIFVYPPTLKTAINYT